jgi:hypothetical protein
LKFSSNRFYITKDKLPCLILFNIFEPMNVPENMSDSELKYFIKRNELFYFSPGSLYNELLEKGYSKEKVDGYISELKRSESKSFKASFLFLSFVLINLGILLITGYSGQTSFTTFMAGIFFCILSFFIIRKVV